MKFEKVTPQKRIGYIDMRKTKQQYRDEALARVKAVRDRAKRKKKKSKLSLFKDVASGGFFIRLIKQERE